VDGSNYQPTGCPKVSVIDIIMLKDEDGQRRDFKAFLGRPEIANAFSASWTIEESQVEVPRNSL